MTSDTTPRLAYRVSDIRAAGLEARWVKTPSGAPIITARDQRDGSWYLITDRVWKTAEKLNGERHANPIREAFDQHTALAPFFSIPMSRSTRGPQ